MEITEYKNYQPVWKHGSIFIFASFWILFRTDLLSWKLKYLQSGFGLIFGQEKLEKINNFDIELVFNWFLNLKKDFWNN